MTLACVTFWKKNHNPQHSFRSVTPLEVSSVLLSRPSAAPVMTLLLGLSFNTVTRKTHWTLTVHLDWQCVLWQFCFCACRIELTVKALTAWARSDLPCSDKVEKMPTYVHQADINNPVWWAASYWNAAQMASRGLFQETSSFSWN